MSTTTPEDIPKDTGTAYRLDTRPQRQVACAEGGVT